jgi:type II secretory pathway pseudopilin PulG
VDVALGILLLAVGVAGVIAAAIAFGWAARKDGEEDRALQRRLGIRRRTRLGR